MGGDFKTGYIYFSRTAIDDLWKVMKRTEQYKSLLSGQVSDPFQQKIRDLDGLVKKYAYFINSFEVIDNDSYNLYNLETNQPTRFNHLAFCFLSLKDEDFDIDFSQAEKTRANVYLVMSDHQTPRAKQVCHLLVKNGGNPPARSECYEYYKNQQAICVPEGVPHDPICPHPGKLKAFDEEIMEKISSDKPLFFLPLTCVIDVLFCHLSFTTKMQSLQKYKGERELKSASDTLGLIGS